MSKSVRPRLRLRLRLGLRRRDQQELAVGGLLRAAAAAAQAGRRRVAHLPCTHINTDRQDAEPSQTLKYACPTYLR